MATCAHLPKGTMIEMTLNKVSISITLQTVDHGMALLDALNIAVLPILKMIEADRPPEPDPDPYLWFRA